MPSKTMPKAARKNTILLATAAGLSLGLFAPAASATDYTFTGTGDWYTAGANPNWTPAVTGGLTGNTLNTAGNTALIQGVVNYNGSAAGDFQVGNGDSMTIDGTNGSSSWTQAAATGNWIKIGGTGGVGTVTVQNGGSFVAAGGLLRLGQDGGTGVFTVASTAGSGGANVTVGTQVGASSTINLQGGTNTFNTIQQAGTLNVTGGTTTVTGAITTSATTVINISGGTVTNSAGGSSNLNAAATFRLSGTGQYIQSGTGEFQPGATSAAGAQSIQSISGNATLDIAGLVAFQGGNTQKFDLNGGSMILRTGGTYDGIYSNGAYFNFTTGSTASILFTNTGTGEKNIFENQIEFNDTAYNANNYTSVFNVTHPTATSTLISLASSTPVPEPGTWLGAGLLLGSAGFGKRARLAGLLRRFLA